MKLAQIFSIYPQLKWGESALKDINHLTTDSREVTPNSVFVAIEGTRVDGHSYIEQVIQQRAAALVVKKGFPVSNDFKGAIVQVEDTRHALSELASRFYGDPSRSMFCVGITGTNGKTSVSYLVEAIFRQHQWPTGVLGTIDHHIENRSWKSQLTTPDPITLQKRLSEFKALKAEAAVFEVSSHALDQGRADSIPFNLVVFTNLSRDHLDYHSSMQDYFAAKQKLFSVLPTFHPGRTRDAIINIDDEYGQKIYVADGVKKWSYGQSGADIQFQILKQDFSGMQIAFKTPRGDLHVQTKILGEHNAYNCAAALAVGLSAGVSLESIKTALEQFSGVPGRLQKVSESEHPIHVFVDYAHTPDALHTVLKIVKKMRQEFNPSARIITVFGCGGDRDKGKRPEMMKMALDHSDEIFVTSDNPRSEDPRLIIDEILAPVSSEHMNQIVFREEDREMAIIRALRSARENDIVIIAGKGHENYQILKHETIEFDDVEVARRALSAL